MKNVLYITEKEVVEMVDLTTAISALKQMLRAQSKQEARNLPKTFATWGDGGSMHALGSQMPERGYLGFKTWANTKQGGAAMFTLFDATNGSLLALIEARALGQLRTSGIAGVATSLMAGKKAREMALIGTGAQAMLQLASVAAVRDIQKVRVFSPTPEKRRGFIERAKTLFGFELIEASSVGNAVEGADIVTLITRAKEPFLHASMLAPKAHMNAVGAILPAYSEFHQDVFDKTDLVVVDDLENARLGSQELREQYATNEDGWNGIRLLSKLIDESAERAGSQKVSLFKGMGMGLSDLALASVAYEKAIAEQRGKAFPHPERIDPISALRSAG